LTTYQPAGITETAERQERQMDWRGLILAAPLALFWLPPLVLLAAYEGVVTTRMEKWE
jgi:hypothetical protein